MATTAAEATLDDCSSSTTSPDDEKKNEHNQQHTATTARTPNPLLHASLVSRLFFTWPYPLLRLGMTRPLESEDLPELPLEDTSAQNLSKLERLWQNEQERVAKLNHQRGRTKKANPSLHRAIGWDFLTSVWYIQPLMMASAVARLVQAYALGLLLETFEPTIDTATANSASAPAVDPNEGYVWASVLVVCGAVILMEHHQVFWITWRKGMQYRTGCVAAIYSKTLRLKSTASEALSSGRVLNLASNDVERFLLAALFVSYLFWAPVQSLAILALGMKLIGAAAFGTGYALLVGFFVPLQFYLSKRFAKLRSKVAALTDERVSLVSQAVGGVRVMKMSAWEDQFHQRIIQLRQREINQIQKANRLKAMNEALFFFGNVTVSISIFLVHVYTGGILSPRIVYTTLTLINILQQELTKHFSLGVMGVSECWVSISRIQKFLEFPELDTVISSSCSSTGSSTTTTKVSTDAGSHDDDDDNSRPLTPIISISNVTCYWNGNGEICNTDATDDHDHESTTGIPSFLIHALRQINMEIYPNELLCVIGVVGGGKSALLQLLAGELEVASGQINRNYGTLSYVSQDPWIMDGTIKENILMGQPFDRDWYDTVVSACCLVTDFEQLQNRDTTIVGDRGVQLSGGQRARIGLARALYRDSDVLLLDDPLSAVDSRVGRMIFYNAILGLALNRNRRRRGQTSSAATVILATHQHQFLHDQRCVLMLDGRIGCIGAYSDCVDASRGKLRKSLYNAGEDDATLELLSQNNEEEEKKINATNATTSNGAACADHDEIKVKGVVQRQTFLKYANAMGGITVGVFFIILFSAAQASVLGTIAAIGIWSEKPVGEQKEQNIILIVIGLGLVTIVLSIIRAFGSFHLLVKASRELHDKMTASVLRARIQFFDTNPLGRILNRFSADVGSNDEMLPTTMFDCLTWAFLCLGSIVTTLSVLPYTFLALPPLGFYFIWVRRIYVTTTRELKRLEGLARSPIYAMLSEALVGIATIRANDALGYFRQLFENVHNSHSRAFFAFISASRWVGFRMDSIMFLFISVAAFLAVLFNAQSWLSVDPAILGLSLSMLLQLSGLFQWAVRQSAEVVNLMVSVERVSEFGNLEPEAKLRNPDTDPPNWPKEGSVVIQNLSVRYRPSLPPALKKVSLSISAGERVGVVGRTGSGKSTLVQALFRLLEAEEGSVQIDGVDIATIGLHTLRGSMSVIPQSPTLFSGCTIRENLDPFGSFSDDEISQALRDAHMLDTIREQSSGLDSIVAEGGTNYSVGQRQLLCLARAILRKAKLLILDEATANVDTRTDHLLQEAIARSFRGATIIAVAHRLDTVIDYDKILVLGNGEVIAYDTPNALASEEGSVFSSMIDDTGKGMATELRRRSSFVVNKGRKK